MQIVIDIPEHYYENNIKKELPICLTEKQVIAILPKGHGRLGDLDALAHEMVEENLKYDATTVADWCSRVCQKAQTIIEADSESENDVYTY